MFFVNQKGGRNPKRLLIDDSASVDRPLSHLRPFKRIKNDTFDQPLYSDYNELQNRISQFNEAVDIIEGIANGTIIPDHELCQSMSPTLSESIMYTQMLQTTLDYLGISEEELKQVQIQLGCTTTKSTRTMMTGGGPPDNDQIEDYSNWIKLISATAGLLTGSVVIGGPIVTYLGYFNWLGSMVLNWIPLAETSSAFITSHPWLSAIIGYESGLLGMSTRIISFMSVPFWYWVRSELGPVGGTPFIYRYFHDLIQTIVMDISPGYRRYVIRSASRSFAAGPEFSEIQQQASFRMNYEQMDIDESTIQSMVEVENLGPVIRRNPDIADRILTELNLDELTEQLMEGLLDQQQFSAQLRDNIIARAMHQEEEQQPYHHHQSNEFSADDPVHEKDEYDDDRFTRLMKRRRTRR